MTEQISRNLQFFIQDTRKECVKRVTSVLVVRCGIVLPRRTPDRTFYDR